jgi:TPP-dependent pyruvate/acetoin dehydrogenase alpha subunit
MNIRKIIKKIKIKKKEILNDYKVAIQSRKISIIGRKEVLKGKAKFGIFGDGKELAQIAMSKIFQKGDFRSGYYRDQTFMIATKSTKIENYFSQLYANTNIKLEPSSCGRMMNNHFATRLVNKNGKFKKIKEIKNSTADISPNASQMPRLIGLGYASKLYKKNKIKKIKNLSNKGNEISLGTIGDAATSEGMFFESINAGGVLQIPIIISI